MAGYNDNPTLEDSLGRDKLLKKVADTIINCDTPAVIGVFGDWGSGKTSFLCQLQLALCGVSTQIEGQDGKLPDSLFQKIADMLEIKETDSDLEKAKRTHPVVWFEAWRYQHEPQPVVALLQEIRQQFSPGAKLADFVSADGRVALQTALLTLEPFRQHIADTVKTAKELSAESNRARYSEPIATSALRQQLDQAIQTIIYSLDESPVWYNKLFRWKHDDLPTNNRPRRRLVVVIDDLDRCEPEAAWNLLEGLKVFLNLKNTVFVLGLNQQVVEDRLRLIYEQKTGSNSSRFYAREYLEKICPRRFHISLSAKCSKLVDEALDGLDLRAKAELVDICVKYLPPNPRKLKAFLQVFRDKMANVEGVVSGLDGQEGAVEDRAVAERSAFIAAYLSYFHHHLYRLVEMDVAFYSDVLREWTEGKGTAAPDEPLASVDRTFKLSDADENERKKLYVDPVRREVFHIQELVTNTELREDIHRAIYCTE